MADEKQVRKHLWVFESDWEKLQAYFGSTIGVSAAARTILRDYIKRIEEKANAQSRRVTVDPDVAIGTGEPPVS